MMRGQIYSHVPALFCQREWLPPGPRCLPPPLTLAGTGLLAILAGTGGGGTTPPRVSPLIELELRDKNQRIGRDERKPKIPKFKGFGHLVTSQVKKRTKNDQMVFRQ